MKKLLLLLSIFTTQLSISNCFAQCSPNGSITTPGIIASPSTVDCISRGVEFNDTIQFMNFDSIFFGGNWVNLNLLRIDSVNNLPCGINWQLSNANGIYQNSEQGCISLFGTTYDTIGQYKLDVWASIDVGSGFFGPLQANNFDILTFYTRVKYPAASCPFIDTLAANTITQCNSTYGMGVTISTTNNQLCSDMGNIATLTANVANGSGHYSYSWNYGDSLSCSDCASTVFDAHLFQTGTFLVTVTVYDSISTQSETQTIEVIVTICGGINESNMYSRLNVFPNPGDGVYTVEFPQALSPGYTLSLKDLQGKEIQFSRNSLSANRLSLNIEDVSPGIYFLFAAENGKFYVNKLLKK